jgi:hypothetical protein
MLGVIEVRHGVSTRSAIYDLLLAAECRGDEERNRQVRYLFQTVDWRPCAIRIRQGSSASPLLFRVFRGQRSFCPPDGLTPPEFDPSAKNRKISQEKNVVPNR